jgi:protein TonB
LRRFFGRRLLRGVTLLVSAGIHLAVLAAALVVAARLAPRIEATIYADLVTLEAEAPPPPVKPEVRPPRPKPLAPPTPKPLVLPRLAEATTPALEPPTRLEERLSAPAESPRTKPEALAEPPRPDQQSVNPPSALPRTPESESPRPSPEREPAPDPARLPSAGGGAPGNAKSPENLPAGVSMLAHDRASGDGGGGTGRGVSSGTSVASSTGGAGQGITRTAIPRGGYQVQPRYPASARRLGIQGTTLLRVFVSTDGRVTDVGVEQTAGHGDLDNAAADAVRRWRFEPARRGEEPVGMWVLLPVEFRLK